MKVLDLFCGCGGFTQGFESAGFSVVAGIDFNQDAINSYKSNWSHIALCRDLTKYSPQQFSDETKISDIDVIIGGPPCQGFSNAGRRDANDPRNSLFQEFVKYIEFYQPKMFVMENVIGILSMKTASQESVIDIIMNSFDGYNCLYFKLYASDYGVPQNRRRVIIIGFRSDLQLVPSVPEATTPERIPVGSVLQPRSQVSDNMFLSEKAKAGIQRKRDAMKKKSYGFGAQIIDPERPCYTIPARYWKDGYDALVGYEDGMLRRLTVDEIKAIQSFPHEYIITGSKKAQVMQLGNAVAPVFITEIASHLKKELEAAFN